MEKRNKGPRGGESCSQQSTVPAGVHHALLCPSHKPLSWWKTHQMNPQETKRANEGSFLFDFKIPATKQEVAALSWCSSFAPSAQGDVPRGLSSQAPWSWPQHPLRATVGGPGTTPSTGITGGSQVRRRQRGQNKLHLRSQVRC